jgi:pimeloyl-ACP methyl ester carboxylesterase
VTRATFVGHSWGGGIALAAALDHPERVAALVLVSSIGTRSSVSRLDRVLGLPVLGEGMAFVGFRLLGRLLLDPRVRASVAREADVIPLPDLRSKLDQWRSRAVWRSFAVEQRAFLRETPGLEDRLGTLDVAAAVITGELDRMVPPRAAEELAGAIAGALRVRVPDAGHLLPYEAPDVVARTVAETAARAPG